MSEKHKSKYKKPENKKPTYRKDLKDYTLDDKEGKLNPKSTGEKQSNVLRKTDKPVVDDGKYDVKYNSDDRLYKDLEDGEYDPKHAAKVLKKRQDADEKLSKDQIRDKIENLTREGKELFIRKYIQANILKILKEAEEPVDPNAPVEPTPEVPTEPAAETPAPAAPTETPSEPVSPIAQVTSDLAKKNTIEKIEALSSIIKNALADTEPDSQIHFYKLFFSNLLKQRAAVVQAKQETQQ